MESREGSEELVEEEGRITEEAPRARSSPSYINQCALGGLPSTSINVDFTFESEDSVISSYGVELN